MIPTAWPRSGKFEAQARAGRESDSVCTLTGTLAFEDEALFFLQSLRESLLDKGYGPESEAVRRFDALLKLARDEGRLCKACYGAFWRV